MWYIVTCGIIVLHLVSIYEYLSCRVQSHVVLGTEHVTNSQMHSRVIVCSEITMATVGYHSTPQCNQLVVVCVVSRLGSYLCVHTQHCHMLPPDKIYPSNVRLNISTKLVVPKCQTERYRKSTISTLARILKYYYTVQHHVITCFCV